MRSPQMFRKVRWISLGILVFTVVIILTVHKYDFWRIDINKVYFTQERAFANVKVWNDINEPDGDVEKERIVIGMVSCDKANTTTTSNLGVVLIKSILISANLHKVSVVAFHIFLESMGRQLYFKSKLEEYAYLKGNVEVELHFHSVRDAIPEMYHNVMVFTKGWRCSFVRLFMASNLPNEDAIIYFDTDNIVTGNIRNIWNLISDMNERQLIGVAPASEPWDKNFDHIFKFHFADIPHVPPKGLNSGVLVMNLTKMRNYGWRKKMFEIYDNYSKSVDLHADQRILNIHLHFERDLLKQIPCNYNYEHIHCDSEQICIHAEGHQNGVEILHGAGGQYVSKDSSLFEVFRAYRDFNLSFQEVREKLMMPLRRHFENQGKNSRCYGSLNRLLFKNVF
ncbi:unnamed protein product [Orchesella dallaii]|uniref:UDP-D-xylose:beta-D-glucoside alpha-1,3-D-xylosyltransferase n=1 Tax=Orchesella dallaii TaxID=48710 RepID=A0ABP1QCD9_9HEXA